MKKKITVACLAIMLALMCCAFTPKIYTNPIDDNSENATINMEPTPLVELEEAPIPPVIQERLDEERIESFTDPNMLIYTMEELDQLIEQERSIQNIVLNLAQSARALGWPEDSISIRSAQNIWWNSDLAIKAYQNRQSELCSELELAKWKTKKTEYLAATEIWLYMKDLGWNDYVCAGILGNLMTEVGGQTLDIQYWLSGNGYYGMCQWNKAYQSGVWGADLKEQCDFLRDTIKYEIDTFGYAYKKGFNLDSFLAMTNEKDAALAFAKTYERCDSDSYSIRQKNATVAYDYFVNN